MQIEKSTAADIEEIYRLYRLATEHQVKIQAPVAWPEFSRELIETAIAENRQWKLVEGDATACVWTITYKDPEIWEERDADPSIYLHRIATNPDFRGQNLVGRIVDWAVDFARENRKQFVRMDTVGENQKLIDYYTKQGFEFLGIVPLKDWSSLPAHYEKAMICLFEMRVAAE